MHTFKRDAAEMKFALLNGKIRTAGEILGHSRAAKKKTADGVSNAKVEEMYDLAMKSGAWAGKVSGPGRRLPDVDDRPGKPRSPDQSDQRSRRPRRPREADVRGGARLDAAELTSFERDGDAAESEIGGTCLASQCVELSPLEGEDGRIVEPGDCFEWARLFETLARWETPGATLISDGTARFARRHGLDPERGVVINEVMIDGSIRNPAARLWPQTERLKAALARYQRTGEREERTKAAEAYAGRRNLGRRGRAGQLHVPHHLRAGGTHGHGGLEHVIERLFTAAVAAAGYRLADRRAGEFRK